MVGGQRMVQPEDYEPMTVLDESRFVAVNEATQPAVTQWFGWRWALAALMAYGYGPIWTGPRWCQLWLAVIIAGRSVYLSIFILFFYLST